MGFGTSIGFEDGKYDLFSLAVQFNNFLGLSLKNDSKETPQYIGKNRQIAGGQAHFNYYKSADEKSTLYRINPQFGQFITSRVLLKGEFTALGDADDKENSAFNTTVAARYYLPIGKRFFMYPELSATYLTGQGNKFSVVGTFSNTLPDMLVGGLSIGGSYFLSKNIAIDLTFSKTQVYFGEQPNKFLTTSLGVGTIGLLYFIK
jgi:hypothetical protein